MLPKVLLHDHLDGGLRPGTIVELADEVGHPLPTTDPTALGAWFVQAAGAGSLDRYLETFAHTVAVMQTAPALRRVAAEAIEDLAADGVVLAEVRFAPELHTTRGLTMAQVVDAVLEGFDEGVHRAAAAGRTIRAGAILSAMRQAGSSRAVAELALATRDRGVVGFDIAGPEAAFPPALHAEAFALVRDGLFPATVHAGEDGGLGSIAQAVQVGGALRLGHGVRIVDDLLDDPDALGGARLGPLAHWVRDRRIALETCPSSNIQTGAARDVATHPVTRLLRLGFAVTVNTDNRLQSGTTLGREMSLLVSQAGWTLEDLRRVTTTAAHHAFVHEDERTALIDEIITAGFARVGGGRQRA
jgi:adenosine deaminase